MSLVSNSILSPEGGIAVPVVSTLVVIHILIDDVLAVPIV
jgi:hypothetical protein